MGALLELVLAYASPYDGDATERRVYAVSPLRAVQFTFPGQTITRQFLGTYLVSGLTRVTVSRVG